MLMCRGTVAAILWPGSMQVRNSGCATTDRRLRSTTALSASTFYEERKQERFDNRSRTEPSVVETGKSRGSVHAIHSAHALTESKIAGCRRRDHAKHAPALQWQERSEVK